MRHRLAIDAWHYTHEALGWLFDRLCHVGERPNWLASRILTIMVRMEDYLDDTLDLD